jgi:hypothetical protein
MAKPRTDVSRSLFSQSASPVHKLPVHKLPVVDPVWTTTASKTVTPQCGYGVSAKNYVVSVEFNKRKDGDAKRMGVVLRPTGNCS